MKFQLARCRVNRPLVARSPVVVVANANSLKRMNDEQKQETEEERTQRILKETTRKIKDLGRAGKPRDALNTLVAMAESKVQPDTQVATALIDACARNGQLDMAQNIFDELFAPSTLGSTGASAEAGGQLQGGNLQPDELTFIVLLRGYLLSSNPPRWTTASTVLTGMERNYGVRPTCSTFNVLLECCAKNNDLERGTEILERMYDGEIEPDVWTFEAVKQRKALRSVLKKLFSI